MHWPEDRRGRGRQDYQYLSESDPATNQTRFTNQALDAQVTNGRNALISPWLVHNLSGTKRELEATVAFAGIAHESPKANGRKLLLGFEATENILADPISRNHLLNELVETPEHPIYLRMTVAGQSGPPQYANERALMGLRMVSESMKENGRSLLLPQSGLAGWLMLGFGARAFGSGVQFSSQRPDIPRTGGGGGGGAAPLHWYFWPPFLGFVLAEEVSLLATASGFQSCSCPFCGGSLPPAGAAFDNHAREAADKHFLWWCAQLCEDARRTNDRKGAIRWRIEAAQSHWAAVQGAGVRLDSRSRPDHLEVWSQVAA
jgi:hypothetical protein